MVLRDLPIDYYALRAIQNVHFIIILMSLQRLLRLAHRMSVTYKHIMGFQCL